MQFIPGSNRHQSYFSTLEDQVSADNAVRLIDAIIDKLELRQLEFVSTTLFVVSPQAEQHIIKF